VERSQIIESSTWTTKGPYSTPRKPTPFVWGHTGIKETPSEHDSEKLDGKKVVGRGKASSLVEAGLLRTVPGGV